jgi:hypothetical protein
MKARKSKWAKWFFSERIRSRDLLHKIQESLKNNKPIKNIKQL